MQKVPKDLPHAARVGLNCRQVGRYVRLQGHTLRRRHALCIQEDRFANAPR